MKKTLQEHIARIKEISMLREDVNLTSSNSNQVTDNIFDNEKFDDTIEKILQNLLSDVSNEIDELGYQVSDKDGTLEPIGENDGQLRLQGETIKINEVGLSMAAGVILAAPKVIEMIGKGTKQLGKTIKSDWIRSAGESATEAGKKLHHMYGSKLLGLLKRIPKYQNMSEEKQKAIADGILLAATVAAGIAAANGVQSAIEAGHQGIAAIETGLGGVKFGEVAGSARLIIPNILNGIFR